MPHIDSHAPGTFTWVELHSPDQKGSKAFYSSLFGWTAMDFPMGPDEVYTMFNLEGRNTGACCHLRDDLKAQGVPPHWLLYVETANADETAAKVGAAGGTVVVPPFDVMQFGRMAVLQDPTGAVFAVWQSMMHHGTGITGVPGTMCWADLMTTDNSAASAFYKAVFGWEFNAGTDNSGYMHIKSGEEFIGGMPPSKYLPAGVPAHWFAYFHVVNCDESTNLAKAAGANLCVPPTSMEGVGRWSIIGDPQGAMLALFEPAQH
ncbi:MAG: VOC family protein [Acidobacteria bacterium]|nr:VOC family protein [Acidobacteriota bacterium]